MPKIDLHMHSTASDGAFAPSEVVHIALQKGLEVLALTDHDTLGGIPEAIEAAQGTSLKIITGIEVGIENGLRDVHVLGYGIDPNHQALNAKLEEMREFRLHRMEKMVDKLNAIGIGISKERVREIAGGAVIARPHIAKAMIEIGVVTDYNDAFNKYIGNDSPYYVKRLVLTPVEGIRLIHEAGGIAVVAHPCRYLDPLGVVNEFIRHGVDGVEIYYPDNSYKLRDDLFKLATKHNLVVTGGSDFHRPDPNGNLSIGCEDIPMSVVEGLEARLGQHS